MRSGRSPGRQGAGGLPRRGPALKRTTRQGGVGRGQQKGQPSQRRVRVLLGRAQSAAAARRLTGCATPNQSSELSEPPSEQVQGRRGNLLSGLHSVN